jgi:hypothetical protein
MLLEEAVADAVDSALCTTATRGRNLRQTVYAAVLDALHAHRAAQNMGLHQMTL